MWGMQFLEMELQSGSRGRRNSLKSVSLCSGASQTPSFPMFLLDAVWSCSNFSWQNDKEKCPIACLRVSRTDQAHEFVSERDGHAELPASSPQSAVTRVSSPQQCHHGGHRDCAEGTPPGTPGHTWRPSPRPLTEGSGVTQRTLSGDTEGTQSGAPEY